MTGVNEPSDATTEMNEMRDTVMLLNAVLHWDMRTVMDLVQRGVNPSMTFDNLVPMGIAAHMGFYSAVRFLLEHGAAVDDPDAAGNTALHFAAMANDEDMANLLCRHYANPWSSNDQGDTPYDLASDALRSVMNHWEMMSDSGSVDTLIDDEAAEIIVEGWSNPISLPASTDVDRVVLN